MANVDIANETLKVGNALASVRIDQMILNLAKGIAWGQYELDKVGVEITKMMGVPGTVSIGGEQLSMLEAGFVPSFYHFVDTILEYKMDVSIREEDASSQTLKMSQSGSTATETYAEVGMSASAEAGLGPFSVSAEMSAKAGYNNKTTSAYSRSLDATHAQKFNQDLAASSSMRTKIVPIPPPDLLVERIKILLERLRKEAEDDDAAQILFKLDGTLAEKLNAPAENEDAILIAFRTSARPIPLKDEITVTKPAVGISKWSLAGKVDEIVEGKPPQIVPVAFFIEKSATGDKLNVYKGKEEDKRSASDIIKDKIKKDLLGLA